MTGAEVYDLHDWLQEYEAFKEHWPFNDVFRLVGRILEDDVVTSAEREEVLEFCENFLDKAPPAPIGDVAEESPRFSRSPRFHTVAGICESDPTIEIESRLICFTGKSRFMKRAELEKLVQEHRGIPRRSVTLDLHYLVICAGGSELWSHTNYGRKIEKAMNYNETRGSRIRLIHEDHFAMIAAGLGE